MGRVCEKYERELHYGDIFDFNISDFHLDPDFLRRIRCLNVADYTTINGLSPAFYNDTLLQLLNAEEINKLPKRKKFQQSLADLWNLTKADLAAQTDVFVCLTSLLSKQQEATLNRRLHQAFDLIEYFYRIHTLEDAVALSESCINFDEALEGIIERCFIQNNPWLRYAMIYLLVDLVTVQYLKVSAECRIQLLTLFDGYANLQEKWLGVRWLNIEAEVFGNKWTRKAEIYDEAGVGGQNM